METEQKVSLLDIEVGLRDAVEELYEVNEAIVAYEGKYAVDSGEIAEAQQLRSRRDELRAVCEAYLTEAPAKRDRVAAFIKHCEAQVEHCMKEKERINTRQKQIERMLEGLKGHFVHVMHTLGTRKLEGNTSVISLRKCPDKLEIRPTGEIPAKFLIFEPPPPPPPAKVDTAALLKWCKAERERWLKENEASSEELAVDGIEQFEPIPGVRIVPGGDSLQVR